MRLGREAGHNQDLDVTALQYRSEAQENLILQLSEQVPPNLPHLFRWRRLALPMHAGWMPVPARTAALLWQITQAAKRPSRSIVLGCQASWGIDLPVYFAQVEFLTGQLAGACAELETRAAAPQFLQESERARTEVCHPPLLTLDLPIV